MSAPLSDEVLRIGLSFHHPEHKAAIRQLAKRVRELEVAASCPTTPEKVAEVERTLELSDVPQPDVAGLRARLARCRSFSDLVSQAIRSARPHRTTPAKRWVAVMDTFAVGSTMAVSLCLQFDSDPYEEVPGVVCGACAEEGGE